MSLLKIPLSASVIWAVNMTLTRPQRRPDKHERVGPIGFEVSLLPIVVKTLCLASCVCEMIGILAARYPSSIPSRSWALTYLAHSVDSPSFGRVTPAIALSWICALSGAFVRRRCYVVMGRMFTFELSIRKDHRLVTDGPYGVVRHPAYSGAALCLFGALAYNTLPGAYFREEFCAIYICLPWLVRSMIGAVWLLATVIGMHVLHWRTCKEDLMLREEFGSEWESWASLVRYKLVPGVY